MCIRKTNNVKPKGDYFYKIFHTAGDDLRCFVFSPQGNKSLPLGNEIIKRGRYTSTSIGFHCFGSKMKAEKYAEMVEKELQRTHLRKRKSLRLIVKKIKMSDCISSGKIEINTLFPEEMKEENIKYGQAFTFKYMWIKSKN